MVEAIWITIALFGMTATYFGLQRAKRDRTAAEQWTNGKAAVRRVQTGGAVFRNRVRMVIFGWWAFIGMVALLGDLVPQIPAFPDIPRITGLLGLIGTAIGHVFIVFHENHENVVLDELLARVPPGDIETQYQREDREMGDHRRVLPSVVNHRSDEGDQR